jgi:hypothetical protein
MPAIIVAVVSHSFGLATRSGGLTHRLTAPLKRCSLTRTRLGRGGSQRKKLLIFQPSSASRVIARRHFSDKIDPETMVTRRTRYFNWEGDACRLHEQKDGSQTADIYRAGRGILPISPADLFFCASEIGYGRYKELVEEEDALSEPRPLTS